MLEQLVTYLGSTRNAVENDLAMLRKARVVRVSGYAVTDKPGPAKKIYSLGSEPDARRPPLAPKKRKSKPKILQRFDGPNPGIDDDEFERQRFEALREFARTYVPKRDPLFAMFSTPLPEKETT